LNSGAVSRSGCDAAVGVEAFRWLQGQTQIHGDVLPIGVLREGFDFGGTGVRLMA
jgi:hypothetical protein